MAQVKRSVRVSERMREELAALLARGVNDPRVQGAAITDVQMTDDLQLARIYVRLSTNDEAARRKGLLQGLESASGLLRRELGKRLKLRYAPKLAFHYDEGHERRDRVDALLAEIEREAKAKE